MQITAQQLRSARAFLNLSLKDVSAATAIGTGTLSDLEQEKTANPRSGTLDTLRLYYETHGIEFTQSGGVRPNLATTKIYEGRQGFQMFMDDVYETAKEFGGNIYLFNSRPRLWHQWLGEDWYKMHSERMKDLGDSINVKIVVEEGDDVLILKTAQHKWFPKGLYKNKIFYAYGPKLAFLDFDEENVRIIVIRQQEFAEIFRVLYDVAWENVAIDLQGEA